MDDVGERLRDAILGTTDSLWAAVDERIGEVYEVNHLHS